MDNWRSRVKNHYLKDFPQNLVKIATPRLSKLKNGEIRLKNERKNSLWYLKYDKGSAYGFNLTMTWPFGKVIIQLW